MNVSPHRLLVRDPFRVLRRAIAYDRLCAIRADVPYREPGASPDGAWFISVTFGVKTYPEMPPFASPDDVAGRIATWLHSAAAAPVAPTVRCRDDDRLGLTINGRDYELATPFEELGVSLGVTEWRGPVDGFSMLAGATIHGEPVALFPLLINVSSHRRSSSARLDDTRYPEHPSYRFETSDIVVGEAR